MITQKNPPLSEVSDSTWHIQVWMEPGANRRLLVDELQGMGTILTEDPGASAHTADLIICDGPAFERHRSALQAQKDRAAPLHLPLLLITSQAETNALPDAVWETADGVVRTPMPRRVLRSRVQSLLQVRQYSQELRRSENRYRTFVEQASDGIFVARLEGTFVEVNRQACAMTGFTRDELLSMRPEDLATEQSLAETPVRWEEYEYGEAQCYERIMQRKDGSSFPVEISVRRIDGGFVQAIARDITERKEREQRFQSLVQNMPGVVYQCALAPDGTMSFHYISPSIEVLAGVSPERVMENPDSVLRLIHPADRADFDDSVRTSAESLEPWHWEGRYTAPDGDVRWVQAASEPRTRLDGTIAWEGVLMDITERKQAEEALRHQRSLLEQTQRLAGAWAFDLQSNTLSWTDEVYRIHELPVGTEIDPDTAIDFYAPEARPIIRSVFERCMEESIPYDLELPIITAKGARRWVRTVGAPTEEVNGRVVKVAGAFQDITERWEATDELRDTKQLLEKTLESLEEAVIVVDPSGRQIMACNTAVEQIFGHRKEALIGKTTEVLHVDREAYERFGAIGEPVLEQEGVFTGEYEMRHKEGHIITTEHTVTPLQGEEWGQGVVSVIRDITERKKRERQLEESRRRLQALFDNALDAILLADDTGQYVEVNPAACELVGYGREELLEMSIWDLTPGVSQEQGRAAWDTFIAAGTQEGEYVLRRKDGSTLTAEYRAVADVVPGLHLSILRDITARLEYEERLVEAKERAEEMSRLKSAFLANMSHEIRTPLTSIIGFAEVLRDDLEGEPLEFVELIHTSSQRLQETLTSVLDLARIESGSMTLRRKRVDLVEIAEGVVEMFRDRAQRKALDLRLHQPEEGLVAEIDPGAFERMLMNLVSNAIKFTSEGHVDVQLTSTDDRVLVTVEDTGVGIHESLHQKIFDEFKQESEGFGRSYEGSGLGLTITKRLAELMGGSIAVDSTKGEGSTFTLTFPRP